MIFDPNPLFFQIAEIFSQNYSPENKVVICNEGSTRSSKTWDFFHLLVMFCDHNRNKHNEIYILRETLTNCKDYTFKEFKKCLQVMKVWNENKFKSPQKPYYDLFGNDIYFRGLDDAAEGYPSDILFINEALENSNKEKISTLRMRCRKLMVMDWNPKYTDHWCFDLEGQPNTFFTHSTYKNNKHLQKSVIKEIESYDPSNPENVKTGTADDFRHKVYALGIRATNSGLVFKNVNWINSIPKEVDYYAYGLDFGFTNHPSALTRIALKGNDLFVEYLVYEPTENADILGELLSHFVEKGKDVIWCDPHSPAMITSLDDQGYLAYGAKSFPGCILFRIDLIKRYKIHVVRSNAAQKEFNNYAYRVVEGKQLNEPIKEYDHGIDSFGYALQMSQ
jgi:phage terminase large subunit